MATHSAPKVDSVFRATIVTEGDPTNMSGGETTSIELSELGIRFVSDAPTISSHIARLADALIASYQAFGGEQELQVSFSGVEASTSATKRIVTLEVILEGPDDMFKWFKSIRKKRS